MDAELRGRKREDQPPVARVDVLPAERVAEEGTQLLGFGGVKEDVRTDDSHVEIL
jgi:hypothetical protein